MTETKIDKRKAKKILQAYSARKGILDLLDPDFEAQNQFINDPAKLKAALCTRRAGKSYGLGLYLFKEALETPGCNVLYVGLTRESAKANMWDPVLKEINRKHSLGARFNEVALTVRLGNGSLIYLLGANASSDEQEKIRGNKYKLACVDECQSFTQNLRNIVMRVIKPCTWDYSGTVCMAGTPGNLIRFGRRRTNVFGQQEEEASNESELYHFFYAVTTGLERGWSVHKWSAADNKYMVRQYNEDKASLILANPKVVDAPFFKQEYMGEWFVDSDALVYKYDEDFNACLEAPEQRYNYVLGIDLGFNDASAFVVNAYAEHDSCMYVVESYKKSKMIISAVDKKICELRDKYPIHKIIIDNASKQSVEELKQRFGHPLEAAQKVDKANFIGMMNSDFAMGKIKVLPGNEDLITEWGTLVWDDRSDRLQENASCDNHLADACLYSWRYCFNYLAVPKVDKRVSAEAEVDAYWEKEALKLQKGKDAENFMDRDWGKEFE